MAEYKSSIEMNNCPQNNERGFAIFSGYNQRGIIAFCRFSTENNIPFYIISSGPDDPINDTQYEKNIVYTRKSAKMEVDAISDILLNLIQEKKLHQLFILPSSEYLNRFFLRHKNLFAKYNVNIPLVEEQLYNKVSDKYSFEKLCKKFDLHSPKEYDYEEVITFPCVLKPKRYLDTNSMQVLDKPIIVQNSKHLKKALTNLDQSKYYLQEYIDGNCLYLLFYISKKKDHVIYSQENLIQQDNGRSMIAAIPSTLHTQPISDRFLNLFTEIDFTGLVMVELKYHDGKYYMIEANPRIWGPSQLFLDADIPIFHRFVEELGFHTTSSSETKNESIKYFWYGGINQDLSLDNQIKFYNYSPQQLVDELTEWLKQEIYRRDDTHQVFFHENSVDHFSILKEI